jgi:hypothetical protein
MGCIVHCSWSARRTHVRAQIYCYFRQCFMQPRALAHHTSALSAVLQRRTCAHTGGVQPRRGAARAPPPPPRRRRGARRGRRGAARARRGPLARRGSRPPPPPAGTDAVRAPRFCACATWPYFSIKRVHTVHEFTSSKMHTDADALLIEKYVTGPYSNHARSPSAMALPPAAPRARDRRRITCRRRHARRDARGAHHIGFPRGRGCHGWHRMPERAAALRRRPQK